MKWKDSFDENRTDSASSEDYLDEETYSPWRKGSPGSWFAGVTQKPAIPYILAIAGILILVVALGSLFFGSEGTSHEQEIKALGERLAQLEDSMGKVENLYDSLSQIEDLRRKNDQLKGRFDRMEAAMALRMDHMTQKLESITSQTAKLAAQKPRPRPAAKRPAPASDQKAPSLYHTVKKGDTLYNISRKYSLTTDQLRRLNDLPDETIKLGQRLLVRP